ncbi:MAG: PGPGW domain-containing protein [Sporichthyaceae bacterium]
MSRSHHDDVEIPAEDASPEDLAHVAAIIAGEEDEHLTDAPGTGESAAVVEARRRRRTILLLRKSAITLAGGLIMLAGIAMIPLPGPGWLIVVLGLWVLAKEYEWADRLLDRIRDKVIDAAHVAAANKWSTAVSVLSALGMIVAGFLWATNDDLPYSSWASGGFLAGGGVLALATVVWSVQDLKKKRARRADR